MIRSFAQVGINSADKTMAILAKSDVIIIIMEANEAVNAVVEQAEAKYLQKCIKVRVSGNKLVTSDDMFTALLNTLTNNLQKKQGLVLTTIGSHEDVMRCSHDSLVGLIQSILQRIFTALGPENIDHMISGVENGPELISARVAIRNKIDVRVMAANKYRVRRHGAVYETNEQALRDYILS